MKILFFLMATFIFSCESQNKKSYNFQVQDSVTEKNHVPSENEVLNPSIDSNKVHGIGIFKIGAAEQDIISYFKKSYKFLTCDNQMTLMRYTNLDIYKGKWIVAAKNLFIKTLPPKSALSMDQIKHIYWCPEISTYYVPHYEVDKIGVENCYLVFYKEKLIEVICDHSSELENALEAKYGKATKYLHDSSGYYSKTWDNGIIEMNFWSIDYREYNIEVEIGIKNVDDYLHPLDSICNSNHLKADQNNLKKESKEL